MEILLVRHGEPVTAESATGPVDPELTERGRWQAERLAAWLACEPIDHVVASSKRRAIETAGPLSIRLGLEPEILPDLVEIDRNARVYAQPAVLAERFPGYLADITAGRFEKIGWDSYEVFQERVTKAWRELLGRPRGERVLVACHGGTIGVILSHVLGISTRGVFEATPFASITRVQVEGEVARLGSLHEVAHFDGQRERVLGPEGEGFSPSVG